MYRQTEREREMDRQTERERDGQTNREREREMNTEVLETNSYIELVTE